MVNKKLQFSGKEYANHRAYWTEKLSILDPFIFRCFKNNSPGKSYKRNSLNLEDGYLNLLEKYTMHRDLETFIFLLSGFYILLNKYNRKKIIFDTPLLNQIEGDVQEQTVPIVQNINSDSSIKTLIKAINDEVLSTYKFQNYPLDLLRDKSLKDKSAFSNVLISFSPIHLHHKSENEIYDLKFDIVKSIENKIEIIIEYREGIFPDWFIDNLLKHYERIISHFDNLDLSIKDIEILSEEEKNLQKLQFNDTKFPYPLNKRVVELFEEQAVKTPDHVALITKNKRITYRELNEKSNSLAHFLSNECNVKANTFIGSLFEKTEYAIISLLGILKAGAAYVPIDPGNPKERIYYILDNANINILLTHSDNLFNLENYSGKLLALDIQEEIFLNSTDNLRKAFDIHDVAYLIYTSGSSGKPKGVVIEHEGLVNVALDHVHEFEMNEKDVYLLFMSLAFDGSLLDIFTTILSGASLVLPDKETINNVNSFIDAVSENKVTITTLTPSYLSSVNKAPLESIRILVSAGEIAKTDDVAFYSKFKKLYNGYGPSETTVNVSLHQVDSEANYESVPIGKPRANKKVYILDENENIVPLGIIGEICVGGVGLAREYLNDPDLTKLKFVANPFAPGERLYKTGDLGYWLSDGNIEYVGRNDEQVKINGFRIDLGEIERNLINNRHIKNAVLINNDSEETNEKGLVAYYEKELKLELVPSLGEYFIYDAFIYSSMATDEMRVSGYKKALHGAVKDKIILDPGTGPEMILARHCVEAGAKKVYAVEIDSEAYQAATENIEKYGLGDKVTLIFGDIQDIELPEKIDYVVSALAGNMASSDGCIPIINRFKEHLQYPVNFIPNKYTTFIAGIALPGDSFEYGLSEISLHYINQVFEKFGYQFDLRFCLKNLTTDNIISDYEICETINYSEELEAEDSKSIRLNITKKDKISGLVCWINALSDDVLMINSLEKTHHLPVYFPLFEEGVEVNPGDIIDFTFSRRLSDNGLNPNYFFKGRILAKGKIDLPFEYESYNHKNSFRSSSFYQKVFLKNGEGRKLEELNEQTLKEYLKRFLPYYMIPQRLIPVDDFQLTANGKIDKVALNKLIEQTPKETKDPEPPRNKIEKLLLQIWQSVLGNNKIGIKDDFFMLGGDSIRAIQIASRLHKEGYKVEVKDIFANPVLMNLANSIKPYTGNIDQAIVHGNIPFTPTQKEILTSNYSNISHYNQAVLLYSEEGFDQEAIKATFEKILHHHDALRIILQKKPDGQYLQINKECLSEPLQIEVIDLTQDPEAFQTFESSANRLQKSIDLETGPLLKLGLFHFPDGDYLLIVIHHFVIDGVSWRILFEDIDNLYQKYKNGESLILPLKTNSYKTWSEELLKYSNSKALLKEIDYWHSIDKITVPIIEKEFEVAGNFIKDNAKFTFNLDENETQLLVSKVNRAFNTEINDILLTALAMALEKTFGIDKTLIALEGHGREEVIKDIDISRTIGWFTSSYPIILNVNAQNSLSSQITEVKDQLRRVPNKGIGYGILKYLTEEENKNLLSFKTLPQISFNYLGQFDEDVKDKFFQIAEGSVGHTLSHDEQRRFDFDINAMISDGRFISTIYYNKNHYKLETIERLVSQYQARLKEIIDYCANQAEEVQTPTDFTYNELKIEDLDVIFD